MKRNPQLDLLKKQPKAYGGELFKTRKGRSTPRPLAERATMHLVLRSSQAEGEWAFNTQENESKIRDIVRRFAEKYGVRVVSMANVGNHLHFHIKLGSRYAYRPFIRATTAAIAMAITGASRWRPFSTLMNKRPKGPKWPKDKSSPNETLGKEGDRAIRKFWDYRPFTRVVQSYRAFLNMSDYIKINQIEGFGYGKSKARFILKHHRNNLIFSNSA